MKYTVDKAQQDALEAQHAQVQEDIAKLDPKAQASARAAQSEVDREIAIQNGEYFADHMFAVDAFLKEAGIAGNFKEQFYSEVNKTRTANVFTFQNKAFYKTHDNKIEIASVYITKMENAVTNLYMQKNPSYTFIQLIKLAFKSLWKGK